MVLSEEQVISLTEDIQAEKWIEEARKQSDELKMHYYGTGLTEYLTRIQGLESKAQIINRKKYAISNKSIIEALLRPIDNAWSAKGGVLNVDAGEAVKDEIDELSNNISNQMSIKGYLKNIWFDRFVTDPNGLVFNEVSEDGSKTYPTYKSIHDINKMSVTGIEPDYIVFEPDVTVVDDSKDVSLKSQVQYQWVVDDAFYYRVKIEMGMNVIVDAIPNSFGVVPAFQNSPIFDTEKRIKISPIDKQVELLKDYLIDNSINNIYKKLHGYPIFWMYAQKCDSCKGTKESNGEACSSCGGSGYDVKKDITDGLMLATPKDSDAPTIAPDVAGFVQPDLETWREQRTELSHLWDLIFHSQWGTTVEKSENETATGRFIDAQPVANKLHQYSDIFELVHNKELELISKFVAPTSDVDIHVSYGRRYLIETPDQIWKKYLETLEKGADESTKDLQLSQYYESEFQSDDFMRNYYLKLIKVEPLVHYNIPDVLLMQVSQDLKDMKLAFSDWKDTTIINEVIDSTVEQLKQSLIKYTKTWRDSQQPIPTNSGE